MVKGRDYEFRWNAWNLDHIDRHGVSPAEAEYVVNHAQPPFPEKIGDGKYLVLGQTSAGRYLQVIYIFSPEDVIFVIHAMPMTERKKRRLRRRRK
jgi:uncharacterized DUF497 family protein